MQQSVPPQPNLHYGVLIKVHFGISMHPCLGGDPFPPLTVNITTMGNQLAYQRLANIYQQDSHQHGQSSTSDNHQQQVHFSIDNHQHRTIINNHHWRSYQSGSLSLGGHNFLQFNIFYSILIFVPNIWESYQIGLLSLGPVEPRGGKGTISKMCVQFKILDSILIFVPNI